MPLGERLHLVAAVVTGQLLAIERFQAGVACDAVVEEGEPEHDPLLLLLELGCWSAAGWTVGAQIGDGCILGT